MVIGDWEVTIKSDYSFRLKPGDDSSPMQRSVVYDFKYIPQDYHLLRVIQYLEFITEEDRVDHVKSLIVELKKDFIDKRDIKDVENDLLNKR